MIKIQPSLTNILKSFKKRIVLSGSLVLIIFLTISFLIRKNDFNKVTGAQNLEATYHTLLTINALKTNPVINHWFLPTVTLGKDLDKNIPWGATVPTKTGDYIYTSFTSAGFLAPYFFFETLRIEASKKNIARFNFALGCLVSFLLFVLLVKVLEQCGYSLQIAVIASVLATTVSIFSREALHSHGLVYWSHSLYQLMLIAGLSLAFAHLREGSRGQNWIKGNYAAFLVIIVFLGAWTEWTGYIFGIGLAFLFWFGILIDRPQRRLSVNLFIALAAAGIVTFLHYGLAVGFETAIKAFMGRFMARNTASGRMLDLMNGYVLSFGLFILVTLAAIVLAFFLRNQSKSEPKVSQKKFGFLLFASTIPMLENFIMLQHAGQFSFDRLKFLFPAALTIALAFARQSKLWRLFLAISLMVASVQGYSSYRYNMSKYTTWREVDLKNKLFADLVMKSTDIYCSVLLSNIGVRGYSNLLLNRGIYEYKSTNDSEELINKTQACSAVYLEGEWHFTDLPRYKKALITKPDGAYFSLALVEIRSTNPDFFFTDSDWKNGVARHWPGFFVPNTDSLRGHLIKGSDLIFQNGDIRKILDVQASGDLLYVYVNGPILDATEVGPPTFYFVRSPVNYPQ